MPKKEAPSDNYYPSTRLAFTFGDDNVLVGAGETRKSSPSAFFGQCNRTSLDRTVASDCYRQNITNLILYKRLKLHANFQPEAALALGIDLQNNMITDEGSYIRANWFFDETHRTYWALTLFPLDSDRLRLGYYYDVSWGGTDTFPKNFRKGLAPGLRFDMDLGYFSFFVGAKAALIRSPAEDVLDNKGGNTIKNVERTNYGVFAGVGAPFGQSGVRMELNGGFFQKGTNTRQNALGEPIYAGGFSGRVSWSRGIAIGRQTDIRIFQQDPVRNALFQKEIYQTGLVSVALEAEATGLVQNLEDPDHTQSTKIEWAALGHFGLSMKVGFWRIFAHTIVRSLSAITFDVPGFIPYQALPKDAKVSPEIMGSLGFDYNFKSIDLTLGFNYLILRPATFIGTVPTGLNASITEQGLRKVVIRGSRSGDWDILPPGENELPVHMLRLDLKWSFFESFGVIGQIGYTRDDNLASVKQDSFGHNIRVFDQPNGVNFNLICQVKF